MAAALAEEGEHLLEDPDLQQDDEEESNQADDSDDEAVDGPPEDQANVQETLAELDEPAADEPVDNGLANMHRGHDAGDEWPLGVQVDYVADLTGRTSRDPHAQAGMYPHLLGAGRPRSERTRRWDLVTKGLAYIIISKAAKLATAQGWQLGFEASTPIRARRVLEDSGLIYFHFHRVCLAPGHIQSSLQSVYELQSPGHSLASSFVMATIPEHARGDCPPLQPGDQRKQLPVLVRGYAMLQWAGQARLQRVAYVKVLPHRVVNLFGSDGQIVYDFEGGHVHDWSKDTHCMCIPIDHIENPLILIDQPESAGGEALWRLIPFEEKAFGMYKDKHDVYDLLNPDQDT